MPAVDHVLLDLDGTLLVGDRAVPGAPEALACVRDLGLGVAFLTNDPVQSREQQVERLAAVGIAAAASEIVTSARALAWLVAAELPGAAVLALGSSEFVEECIAVGLSPVDRPADAAAVLLGGSSELSFGDLTDAVRAVLVHGAALYGSNADPTFPAAGGPAPGCGALVAAVERAVGREARIAGKPEPVMFDEARTLLGAGGYLVVGDRLDADVGGGAAAGMRTALVLTGSTRSREQAAAAAVPPDDVLDSVAQLPGLLDAAPARAR